MNIRMIEKRKGLRSGRSRYQNGKAHVVLVEGDVELWVDVDRLMDKLAGAALCNKSGKSVLADGAITALAVDRESEALEVPHGDGYQTIRTWVNGGEG